MTTKSQNKRLVKKRLAVPMHYSRTMTADNLSKAANTVGEWVLTGLGKAGQAFNELLTSGASTDFGLTSPFVMSSVKERRAIQNGKYKALKKANEKIAQGMTWVSPLNYGAAVWNGHGLNAKKGEEEVASWSPAWQAVGRVGELYLGPKVVKGIKSTPKVVVNTAAKAGVKPAKAAVIAKEINKGIKQNTKNGRIEVTENYFNAPDKWYRVSETPEKFGILELGKNVTTTDSPQTNGTADGFRRKIINKYKTEDGQNFALVPGKGTNEGYFVKLPVRFSFSKDGAAHGNTSQAAARQIWQGTFAQSGKFPKGIIEGLAPSKIYRGMHPNGTDSRTNFILLDWENVPKGARVGFHTGEMPMSNLGWFQKTNRGTYTYEPIIPENRITYQSILLLEQPSTSLKFFERKPANISEAERTGATKWERNFKPKWHVANYPGYLLKGLMKGSRLEKQLSKKGTININLLNAYFNKASQVEKDVTNKVLAEKFDGLKTIDYNLFKKAVLDELIGKYNRVPLTEWADYGIELLGFETQINHDANTIAYNEITGNFEQVAPSTPFKPNYQLNTFTFESPRLPLGNNKHYNASTIGHTRTFTNQQEPWILYVMESLSDWGLAKLGNNSAPYVGSTKYLNDPAAYREFIDGHKRLLAKMLANPSDYLSGAIEKQIANIERHEAILKLMLGQGGWNPLVKYLHDNYLQRQLQENLRYAAENGLTKMRYPTPETAVKIEGYRKVALPRPTRNREIELQDLLHKMWTEYYDANESQLKNVPFLELDLIGRRNIPNYAKLQDELNQLKSIPDKYDYPSEYKTILKKYSDFPKLFLKLYKGLDVKIVTDTKGNTWYEVGVPKGYLNSEWLFKQGGKML